LIACLVAIIVSFNEKFSDMNSFLCAKFLIF
jgi:hypothetical protein